VPRAQERESGRASRAQERRTDPRNDDEKRIHCDLDWKSPDLSAVVFPDIPLRREMKRY
jgi:hypothetical protein